MLREGGGREGGVSLCLCVGISVAKEMMEKKVLCTLTLHLKLLIYPKVSSSVKPLWLLILLSKLVLKPHMS